MIETVCIPILFIALAVNIPVFIAYLIGLQFEVKNPSCKEDVNDVKRNVLMTKIVQGFNVLILLVLIIIFSLI
jgi:hypothetical protein